MVHERVENADQEREGSRPWGISCALPDAEYARRVEAIIEDFSEGFERVEELPDGYALRFPGSERWIEKLVAFVTYERHCCPFFAFELAFEPANGPVWLRLRGDGVRDFLDAVSLPANGVSTHEGAQ